MEWYRTPGSAFTWGRRAVISIDNTAGASSSDVDINIPQGWDDFWDNIDASGNELRVVQSNGQQLATWIVDDGSGGAFDKTNRLGRLRLDNYSMPATANTTVVAWLYFNPTGTAGSAAGSFTPATPINGYIERGKPGTRALAYLPTQFDQTNPRLTFVKGASEEIFLWFNYGRILSPAIGRHNQGPWWEGCYYASGEVVNTSEVAQASMISAADNRFLEDGQNFWFKMKVQAGTDGNNYTARADFRTVRPGSSSVASRLISPAGVQVKNVYHTA